MSSRSRGIETINFEESIFEQLSDIARRLASREDEKRMYALIWALKRYIIEIKRKKEEEANHA
ncbi:MAG: hypothetical protein ACRD8W_18175 [Nitrososphaeraceae archaeon]